MHPIELKNNLLASRAYQEANRVFEGLEISQSIPYEIQREDNPVASFWPFTKVTAERIANMIDKYQSIALLGTPTVFGLLSSRRDDRALLFEHDEYFFPDGIVPGFIKCDVVRGVPRSYDDQFEFVFADPPWYLGDYFAWLETATRIVRPAGSVAFVLYPERIRESAGAERNKILALAREIFEDVSIKRNVIDYETSSFEQIQMIRNGIRPIDWRSADVLVGRTRKRKFQDQEIKISSATTDWIERRVGTGRVFIDLKPASVASFLETADASSRFLSSPSLRNAARLRANVITSRGHALCCSEPFLLISLIESIRQFSDLALLKPRVPDNSWSLFQLFATDLWGRFVVIDQT